MSPLFPINNAFCRSLFAVTYPLKEKNHSWKRIRAPFQPIPLPFFYRLLATTLAAAAAHHHAHDVRHSCITSDTLWFMDVETWICEPYRLCLGNIEKWENEWNRDSPHGLVSLFINKKGHIIQYDDIGRGPRVSAQENGPQCIRS